MPTTIELRDQRARTWEQMKALLDTAEAEKRASTAEEDQRWEALNTEIEVLDKQVKRRERADEIKRQVEGSIGLADIAKLRGELAGGGYDGSDQDRGGDTAGQSQLFDLRAQPSSARPLYVRRDEASLKRVAQFRQFIRGDLGASAKWDFRALSAGDPAAGGYTAVPEEFVARLIKFIDDEVFIRARATTFMVDKAESMGAPSLDADPADADWTSEIATGTEDSTMAFGKRELSPHPLAKRIKVSEKLLRVSALDVEGLVISRLGYKFAITSEKGYLTGNGANQPLGLFVADASGISTGRDVLTGSATDITADGLIDALYACKAQYQARGVWLFHRDGVKRIRKLKDTTNQYLWQPGLQDGTPSMILGRAYLQSEYVPNTFTTGLYVGLFGDLSQYWIVDALDMRVQRLVELYAETNQVGFIGRLESDGMPVLEEAFARLKTN